MLRGQAVCAFHVSVAASNILGHAFGAEDFRGSKAQRLRPDMRQPSLVWSYAQANQANCLGAVTVDQRSGE